MTMTDPPEHKLRWYQYKLSSLFILTILVCLASSWYATVMDNAAKRRKAIVEIERLGGYVEYYGANNPYFPGEPPRWYSWLRKLHGDEHLGNAIGVGFVGDQASDADLIYLRGLTGLEEFSVTHAPVTDAGLVRLKGLTNLERLALDATQITDAGLVHLKGLTNLTILRIRDTNTTDEGVKKLQEALPNCEITH